MPEMTYFIVCGRRRRLREEEGRDEEGIKKEEDMCRWAHEMSLSFFASAVIFFL